MVQIDIRETYSFGEYSFKNYTMLTEAEKKQMLEWRNHETIRKNMYNTQPIYVFTEKTENNHNT